MVEAQNAPEPPAPSGRLRLRWGDRRRIRSRPDYKTAYENGRRIRGGKLTLFCMERARGVGEPAPPWRLGITVTRASGGAVVRNRIRRRIREFFRIHQAELPEGWDLVVNAAPGLGNLESGEIGGELRKVLAKAGLITGSSGGPRT